MKRRGRWRWFIAGLLVVAIVGLVLANNAMHKSPLITELREQAFHIHRSAKPYALIPSPGAAYPAEMHAVEVLSFNKPPSLVKAMASKLLSGWTVDDVEPTKFTSWQNPEPGDVISVTGLWDMGDVGFTEPGTTCSIVISYKPNWLDGLISGLGL